MLLVVFFVGTIGLPVLSIPPKSGRFPCENGPCGCATADHCWDKCCCHSDVEKLQWAIDHGVKPPDFLVARVGKALALVASAPTRPSCCCSKSVGQCVTEQSAPIGSSEIAADEASRPPPAMRLVLLEDAARCHGIDLIWSMFNGVTIDTRSAVLARIEPPFLYSLAIGNDRPTSLVRCPDPPVP